MFEFLFKIRHISLALVVGSLFYLALFGRRVSYEQSIQSFFADNDPDIVSYRKASATFGDDNFVFVGYDDAQLLTAAGIDRVTELAAEIKPLHGVIRVESLDAMPLLWKVDDLLLGLEQAPEFARKIAINAAKKSLKSFEGVSSGALSVGGAIRGGDAQAIAAVRERLIAHPLFRGTLIDGTGTSTALVVRLDHTDKHNVIETVTELRKVADAFAVRHQIKRPTVVGPPVLLADGFSSIETDGRRLAAVGMGLIAVVMLSAVRSVWWALIPLMSGWLVWLGTEMIMATFGLKLSLSGGPLVAQIIVLTMPAASHLAIHFRDDRRHLVDQRIAARSTMKAVWVPILWCALTGAIGYGALVTSNVVPIQQFGWIMGTCTLASALLVMLLAPSAMMPPLPLEWPVAFGSSSQLLAVMNRVTYQSLKHPKWVLVGVTIVVLPLCVGMSRLTYETNYINAFRPDSRVVEDYNTIENRLGGIGLFGIIAPIGKTLNSESLAKFAKFDDLMQPVLNDSATPRPLSIATVLDPDGRLAQASKSGYDRLIATKLDLIAASPQSELLKSFWNAETGEARILVRMREQQPASTKANLFRESLAKSDQLFGVTPYLSGLSYLMTKTTQGVIQTQWTTFLWSVAGILIMLTLALRAPTLAVLAMLPTLLAVGLVLGLMGWLDMKLDMATALVASVALGLSVDDTFHCLLQFQRCRKTQNFHDSLMESYAISGPGVLLSSLAVAIGFAALRLSQFVPFVNFGTMVGIATAGSTLGNLFLLPACLTLLNSQRDAFRARRDAKVPA